MRKLLLGSSAILFILFLWQLNAVRIGNAYLFPFPKDVFITLLSLLGSFTTYQIIFASFQRLITAIFLASLFGVVLGLLAGIKPAISDFFSPVVTSLRTLPVASVIVVILILYGQSLSLYIISFLMLFPILYEATRQGVLNIDSTLLEALTLERRRMVYEIRNIYLPLSYPFIKTGLLQSIGIGFKVLVMAEFIAQSPISIGRALYLGRVNIQYEQVFAWTIIIIFIVSIIEFGVNHLNKNLQK